MEQLNQSPALPERLVKRVELRSSIKKLESDLERKDDQGVTVDPADRQRLQEMYAEIAALLDKDKNLVLNYLTGVRKSIDETKLRLNSLEYQEQGLVNAMLELEKEERNGS